MLRIRLVLLFFILGVFVHAQEHLGPLHSNQALKTAYKKAQTTKRYIPPVNLNIPLPFLDDFSYPGPYPNPYLWADNNAFINNTFPICPHTLGVATLDGLNNKGLPYNPKAGTYSSDTADFLTSRPISLASSTHGPGDSVYLSFYWQAGGLGTYPKSTDTLKLLFKAPGLPDSAIYWQTAWYHCGYPSIPNGDTNFHCVNILIDSAKYFAADGFQFRFMNYACLSGNVDHWNIDEVYLNSSRGHADTVQKEVSFVYESPSLLANYEAMPWEQYSGSADLKTNIPVFIRNNNAPGPTHAINTTYYYDTIPGFLQGGSGGANNEIPFFDSGYVNYPAQSNPKLTFFPYTALTGPTTYDFTQILIPPKTNFNFQPDTLRYKQVFGNYYAYDDGSAEVSYSINPIYGVPTYLGLQYKLNKPDTIIAVEAYFDYVFISAASYSFAFAVWADDGTGFPGKMIYEDTAGGTVENPIYTDSINGFMWYKLKSPVAVSGTVYVGWIQTSGDSINVGYDLNDNHGSSVFYCVDEKNWYQSVYSGSPMIRPVMGNPSQVESVNNIVNPSAGELKLYPNPATDIVYTNIELHNNVLRIYGSDGRLCIEKEHFSGNSFDTSTLTAGFYIVEFTSPEGKLSYQKLLISR